MAKMVKGTITASTNITKFAYYGSEERLLEAASLGGNLERLLRCKVDGKDVIGVSAAKKSEVTKLIGKVVGGNPTISYTNPLLCRKRKGIPTPIDGETRIWVGVCEVEHKDKAEKAEPKKAKKAEPAIGKKARGKKAKKTEAVSETDPIQELTAQVNDLLAKLAELTEKLRGGATC